MTDPLDLAPALRQSREVRFRARYGELMDRCTRYIATLPSDRIASSFVATVSREARASARLTPLQADALRRILDKWESRT